MENNINNIQSNNTNASINYLNGSYLGSIQTEQQKSPLIESAKVSKHKQGGRKKPELEQPGQMEEDAIFSAQDKLNDGLQDSKNTSIGSNPIASELFQAVMAIFSAQLASFKTEALTGYAEMEMQKEVAYQSADAMKKSAKATSSGAWLSGCMGLAGAGISLGGSAFSLGKMAYSSDLVKGAELQSIVDNADKTIAEQPNTSAATNAGVEKIEAQNKLDALGLSDAEKEQISTSEGRKVIFQQQGRSFEYLHTIAQNIGSASQSGANIANGLYQSKATRRQARSKKRDALAALIGSMSNQNMTGSQNCYGVVQGASSILQAYGQMMVSIANTAASR